MNPFDQFGLPPQQQQQQNNDGGVPQLQQQQQFNLMTAAPPTIQEKKPTMGATNSMMMGPYGGNAPPPSSMPYGGQPQQMPYGAPPPQPFGGGGMMFGGGPPPQQQQQQPSSSMMGRGGGVFGGPPMTSNGGGMMMMMGQPPQPNQQQNAFTNALVPSGQQSNPYALGPSMQQQQQQNNNGIGNDNPFGGNSGGLQQQPPPQQQSMVDPFGWGGNNNGPSAIPPPPAVVPPALPPSLDPFGNAMVPLQPPKPPQQQQQQQLALDPWGAPAPPSFSASQQMMVQQQYGQPPPQQQQQSNALVVSASTSADPFGIFGGGGGGVASVATGDIFGGYAPQPPSVHPTTGSIIGGATNDPWADLGFGSAPSVAAPSSSNNNNARGPPPPSSGPVPGEDDDLFNVGLGPTRDESNSGTNKTKATDHMEGGARRSQEGGTTKRKKGELPPGGEWYDAKIFTPTLGVMFFKPKELVESLFLQTEKKLVDALDERPVVAFIVEGSSARSAGVELGHVLLKVNGIDVKNPKEASRLIKEGPRPLPLLFYVPETSVVVAEGEHMVKYDTKDITAPNSAKDWKPKYIVVGGIIAQPWMMNMYRSKSEYDIAVIETQARRPVSVKVKQFSLQAARIQNDWQGPQMVKYKNKLHPWKYIVVLPVSRNPIKIASPNLSQLKPVHEGIRRVLQEQQQGRSGGGGGGSTGGPDRMPVGGGYDARDRNSNNVGGEQHHSQRNITQPSNYYGNSRGAGY